MTTRPKCTPEAMDAAVAAFTATGYYKDAADAAEVTTKTLRSWLHGDRQRGTPAVPGLAERFKEAGEDMVRRIGAKAVRAVERHLDDVLKGRRMPSKYGIHQRTGERKLLQRGERIPLNPHILRTALTKFDPDWVRPRLKEEDLPLLQQVVQRMLEVQEQSVEDAPNVHPMKRTERKTHDT